MLKAIEMLKNYTDVEIFIASILIFINFAPLKPSKRQTKKTIDMKKTLLSALNHGSGTIFILLAMMLGVSLQVWGVDISVTKDEVIYLEMKSTKSPVPYHTLQEGDTYRYIAQLYGLQLKILIKRNSGNINNYKVGDQICIGCN